MVPKAIRLDFLNRQREVQTRMMVVLLRELIFLLMFSGRMMLLNATFIVRTKRLSKESLCLFDLKR